MCEFNCTQEKIETLEQYHHYRAITPIVNAIVNLTDQCNLRCPYCFTCHSPRRGNLDILKATVEFMIKEGERTGKNEPKTFAFFGGEPMLEYDSLIVPFVHWIEDTGIRKKHRFSLSMTTNGTLFTKERLDFFFGHDIGILLSIDGAKDTQDNQRPLANKGSSFDLIEPNIDYLLKTNPTITFRSAIEPWNVEKILENYLYARERGFQHYFITPNVYSEWSEEQCQMMVSQIAAAVMVMYDDIKEGGHVTWCDFFIDDLRRTLTKDYPITTRNITRCGLGTVSMGVAVDGTINGCQEHNTYQEGEDLFFIGNVLTGIDPEKHLRLIKAYQEYERPVTPNGDCEKCNCKDSCASIFCPSSNLGKTGSLLQMPRVQCVWKQFFKDFCPAFLDIVKKENNYNAVKAFMSMLGGGFNGNISLRKS